MDRNAANTPLAIKADREAGTLTIDWADGHRSLWDAETLRRACPCAFCRGELGRPGWLDTNPELTPAQTRLADVRLVGTYALAPAWSDGHDTGYYTFTALREECPCPECAQRRSQPSEAGA